MATLNSRLDKLEQQHAGPRRIWVTLAGSGIYQSNGETLTADEFHARYADDETNVIFVKTYDKPIEVAA